MADSGIAQRDGPMSPDTGPDQPPPSLPAGWTAQWDGSSRKYYFVQISTGVSTWDVPSSPAPHAAITPQAVSPLPSAQGDHLSTGGGEHTADRVPTPSSDRGLPGNNQDGDRGLGNTAFNLLSGKPGQHGGGGHQSGLGGLAQSLLSSGGSHGGSGGSSHGGSAGKIVGQLAGSLLSNKKPSGQSGSGGSGSGHQSGEGLVGSLLGGLGGHHGHHQHQAYGYSTNSSNGPYSGQAPPAQYQPPSQQSVGDTGNHHQPPVSQSQNPNSYGPSQHPQGPYSQAGQHYPPTSTASAQHPYPGQPMIYPQDQQQQPPHQPYHPNQHQYGPGHEPQYQGAYQGPPPGPGGPYNSNEYPLASAPPGGPYSGPSGPGPGPGPGQYSELSGRNAPYPHTPQQSPYPGPGPGPGHGHGHPPGHGAPQPSSHPYPGMSGPGPSQGQYAAHPPPPSSAHHHQQQYAPPPVNAQYGAESQGYGRHAGAYQGPPPAPGWK